MKKEFITTWSAEIVDVNIHKMPIPRSRFFSCATPKYRTGNAEIIVPDDVTYDQLCVFEGRRTKVTIEILP